MTSSILIWGSSKFVKSTNERNLRVAHCYFKAFMFDKGELHIYICDNFLSPYEPLHVNLSIAITFLRNIQCNIASFLFTYCIKNNKRYPINDMYYFFCLVEYMVLCLGWHKARRGSQGFSTHNLNSWAFISVLVDLFSGAIVVFLYCLVMFLWLYSCSSCCKLVFLSLFGVSNPCHYCIPL